MGLATNPDFATEVTLQPLERYRARRRDPVQRHPDRARRDGPRPVASPKARARASRTPLRDEAAVARLAVPDMDKLRYVFDAVASIRRALARPGAADRLLRQPVDARLLHGRGRGLGRLPPRQDDALRAARPDAPHPRRSTPTRSRCYLNAQIDAGAQAVMIFDSWGGVLADGAFQTFSLAYTQRVLRAAEARADGRRVPHIVFTKGGGPVAGRDRRARRRRRRRRLDRQPRRGARAASATGVALQGNLDPNVLFAGARAIRARGRRASLASFGAARPTAAATATSSISATASASTRRPRAWRCWSTRCTSCRAVPRRARRDRSHERPRS